MTKKELIIFKIITTAIIFFSVAGLLNGFRAYSAFNFGLLWVFYLLRFLFSAVILIGAIALSNHKNWGRILLMIFIPLSFVVASTALQEYILFQEKPVFILLLFPLVTAGLIIYYLNKKSVVKICANNLGQQNEQSFVSSGKAIKILNWDISFWINATLLFISLSMLLYRIFNLLKNVIRLGEWCIDEKLLIKIYSIPFVFIFIILLIVIIFKKRKRIQSVIILLSIFSLLTTMSVNTMDPFGPHLTKTKEQCKIDERNQREHQGDVGACAEWEGVGSRDSCYNNLGIEKRDHAICDKIQDEEYHNWCNIMVASYIDDYTYCDKLDKMHSIQCYYQFAKEKKDYTICDHIKHEGVYTGVCQKSACYEIIDPKNLNPTNIEQNTFCKKSLNED